MSLSVGIVGLQRPQGEPGLKPEDLEEDNKLPQGEPGLKPEDLEEDNKMICLTHNDIICRNGGTAAAAGGAWPQA